MSLLSNKKNFSVIFFFLVICLLKSYSSQSSDLLGSVSIFIQGGSEDSPNHVIISPALKGRSVFRGQVQGVDDNNLSFYRIPDVLDPTTLAKPFKPGIFSTAKARAVAEISDVNFTIESINVVNGGNNYLSAPSVYIDFPIFGAGTILGLENAYAKAILGPSQSIVSVNLTHPGYGYTVPPKITIEGGVHFISSADSDSNFSGKFYRIISNSGDQLTLENPLGENLASIFSPDSEVEIFEAWTLGELFGYESTSFNSTDVNTGETTYDYLYLLKDSFSQTGSVNDFEGYFHDGTSWKILDSPSVNADNKLIFPNQSFVIARRSSESLNLVLSGTALFQKTFIDIPEFGKRSMTSNPFGVDLMLSELINSNYISEDSQNPFLWYANQDQEIADNIRILHEGVWTTYWHDGKNRTVTENAFATARAGSGPGASMLQRDLSFSAGSILAMTNPSYSSGDSIVVYSPSHGLRVGFTVKIKGAKGYKTNAQKQLINEFGEVVEQNSSALIIESGANGYHTIEDVTKDTFKLSGKSGDCNFIPSSNARWITGFAGLGYEYNCSVSFVGGGGSGAKGKAIVNKSSNTIESISITEPGSGYIEAPKVVIHSGGWRKQGAGMSPYGELLIPAGGGLMIIRNNPQGQKVRFPVENPLK